MEQPSSAPKISVVMPVYNVQKYLARALDSVLNQTLTDIELICVDDASTDGCPEILREYAAKDPRMTVLTQPHNQGSVCARKVALEHIRGQYVMFIDSDDEFVPTACQTVWESEQKAAVDILQFGVKLTIDRDNEDPTYGSFAAEQKAIEKVFTPFCGNIIRGDLVKPCFWYKRWNHTLWNKAYSAELCQKAFSYMEDIVVTSSDDEYMFYLFSYLADTYRGISDPLYCYFLGRGITGNPHLTLPQYTQHCRRKLAYDAIDRFLKKVGASESHFEINRQMRANGILSLCAEWMRQVSLADARQAYDILVSQWGILEVISCLSHEYWDYSDAILQRLAPSSLPVREKAGKPVKTIGIYYYRVANGGVERVISILIPLWMEMGYEVVLITEQAPSPNDYPLPAGLKRAQIPDFITSVRGLYAARAKAWQKVITQYHIDTIVYAAHVCESIMWDVCMLKGLGCNCIIHSHSTFAFMYIEKLPTRYMITNTYRLCDRVVTLAQIYSEYWGNFCPAYYIPNPIWSLCPREDVAALEGTNILWVGRLSPEKRPKDALLAFQLIHDVIPEATFTMVGGGETPDVLEQLKAYARELDIEASVRFTGFCTDVDPYYSKAALLLFTTQYEGFPMVLVESKCYGIPTVMYDLPYLEMVRDSRGVICVPQRDVHSLAQEAIRLLQDETYRRETGRQARQSAEDFAVVDQKAKWREVFDSLEKPSGKTYVAPERERMMLTLLLDSDQSTKRESPALLNPVNAAELRLLNSKFMPLAQKYWKLTDPIKNRLKAATMRFRHRR